MFFVTFYLSLQNFFLIQWHTASKVMQHKTQLIFSIHVSFLSLFANLFPYLNQDDLVK